MAATADEVTRDLIAWAETILPKTGITAKPASAREREKGVEIRLIGLGPRPAPRSSHRTTVIDLDYLITVQMDDAFAEQSALAELLFAAADRSDFEILGGRTAAEICADLEIPIAAGFVLRATLTRVREAKPVPLVRHPLKVDTAELGVIEGTVLGPESTPIAGAVVTVPGVGLQARSDAHGHFRIAGAPRIPKGVKLNVKARGVELDATGMPGQPVILRLPLEV